jgi:histidyl-tRNA synthetase
MGVDIQSVRGFNDILPAQMPAWQFIVDTATTVLTTAGFKQILVPIIEDTNLYKRGIGQETDVVSKEMFSFEDINKDMLSLRPEATAGIMRAIKENSLLRVNPLLKLYTIGPMFRRERPSKARYRQFYQINAEFVGDDSPYSDAELIVVASNILKSAGIECTLEINSIGCPECRATYKEALESYLESHLGTLCEDCQRRFITNPMRTLDCKEESCKSILRASPLISDYLDEQCVSRFETVLSLLGSVDVAFNREPRLVRGLDYYTGTAFEFTTSLLGRSKAIGGGGRYDGLLASIGGPNVSGVGFAFGLERLVESLPEETSKDKKLVCMIALGDEAQRASFPVIQKMRQEGIYTEARFSGSLKSQMKSANNSGARFVVIIGSNELEQRIVTIKDMVNHDQKQIDFDNLTFFLKERFKNGL